MHDSLHEASSIAIQNRISMLKHNYERKEKGRREREEERKSGEALTDSVAALTTFELMSYQLVGTSGSNPCARAKSSIAARLLTTSPQKFPVVVVK